MPTVMYSEDEMIEAMNEAVVKATRPAAEARDILLTENRKLRDAITRIVGSPEINSVCGWYPEIKAAAELVAADTPK